MECAKIDFIELGRAILDTGACIRFQTFGGSMYPFIKSGQVIQVRPTNISEINMGDIIFYRSLKDRLIVHRVIKKCRKDGKTILLTKGDSVLQFDAYVYPEKILGKVVAIEKNNKIIRIDKGLLRLLSVVLAKLSPFIIWTYFLLRKIKHKIKRMKKVMSSEELLVRYLVKANIDKGDSEKIKEILSPDLNWVYFFERARNGGVAPLAYKNLSKIDYAKNVLPDDVWKRLESSYYTIAARNTLLYEKLNSILSCFNQAKIETIILKGVALAQTIYNDIALRPMYDIDILIHRKDFSSVECKLRELGYINSPSYPEDFYKDDMMVDVHCDLLNITRVKSRSKTCKLDIDEIWENSRLIDIRGQKARILSPENCLMNLCLHLTIHHGLNGLIWFVDVTKLIEFYKKEINWNKFIDNTIKYKICKPIYYVLCYIKENLNQEVPQFVLDKLKPERQNFFEMKIFNSILSGTYLENIRFFFNLSTMENFFDRLRFLREIILPSPNVLSAKYNIPSSKHLLLYYLIHFKHILSSLLKLLRTVSF